MDRSHWNSARAATPPATIRPPPTPPPATNRTDSLVRSAKHAAEAAGREAKRGADALWAMAATNPTITGSVGGAVGVVIILALVRPRFVLKGKRLNWGRVALLSATIAVAILVWSRYASIESMVQGAFA